MRLKHIQDILPLVEAPSRYLGSEINTVQKDHRKVRLKMALAFPDLYEIGTSHFGLQILYHILNKRADVLAERVFAPAPDMQNYLRRHEIPLPSLESGQPLGRFDIIGFSLLYELNYTNMLAMLELAGLPFKSRDRDRRHPLVIAGGPCTCNPEPVADFFDAIVIGDGEEVVIRMADAWLEWDRRNGQARQDLLESWSRLRGVYVPSLFPVHDSREGAGNAYTASGSPARVTRAILADLDGADFPSAPVVPYGRPVHDRLRLELARGCTRGCRFCQAGMIYRPVRERAPGTVMDQCARALSATGYDDISLLSLSTGDYGCIAPLMEQMIQRYACDHVALSLPSLRAGTLTPELMQQIKTVRKTGFTIAPEAGSQRLRDVLNKNVTRRDIQQTVQDAFDLGWKVIKLYFMIGLPTEKKEDLEALVELVRELSLIKGPGGRKSNLNVSVATLIPKPHTPFQWASQISIEEGWEKIQWLKKKLRSPRIRLKWQNPEVSFIEGLMARGDRRLADLLIHAYRKGCRFDGWSDHFRFDLWEESIRDLGVDAKAVVQRARPYDEPFPWDHIDMKVKRSYLWDEWQQALQGHATEDCRDGACQDCGVCDFKRIKPRVYPAGQGRSRKTASPATPTNGYQQHLLTFAKTGKGRFWGHLEMVNIFSRALRRAGITVKFSEGFHPKPKMAFGDALPIGLESLSESLRLTVSDLVTPDELVARLNAELPDGLSVLDCVPYRKNQAHAHRDVVYRVSRPHGQFDRDALARFEAMDAVILERTNRKGKLKKFDLKAMVKSIAFVKPDTLEIVIRYRSDALLRPDIVLKTIFRLPREALGDVRVIKLGYRL
ncbi:MAG: TIGR03960 family B12-binding radical SAM protein [Desulfobacterales bacterium]